MKTAILKALLIVNALGCGFAYGLNSRHILVVDPALRPLTKQTDTPEKRTNVQEKKPQTKPINKTAIAAAKKPKIKSVASQSKPAKSTTQPLITKKIELPDIPLLGVLPPFASSWPGKPVHFEKKVLEGTPLYETVVDLNDPESFLMIGLANGALYANSTTIFHGDQNFQAMVKKNPGAVVVNGTFFSKDDQKRVMGNMVSGGRTLKNSEFETYGTTLGIGTGNRLEMITARLEHKPDMSDYWFSITCGPRLLKAGAVNLDPEAEGFRDPHVLVGAGPRSAIGYQSRTKKLIVVTFINGVTLAQEAKLMLALGCDEAMNLDGGASRALAHQGEILVTPGRPLTNVIVVFDSTAKAPEDLITSWIDFQRRNPDAIP